MSYRVNRRRAGYAGLAAAGPTGGVARMTTSRGSVGANFSGGYDAYPGDTWTVTISGALPNVPVIREQPLGATGVQMGTTDGTGSFSISGTFTNADVGQGSSAWSAGGWASGNFKWTVAPALGGSSGGPYGPQFDPWYQGGGYYNTLAMDAATYAAFDAARNAGPRVPQVPAPVLPTSLFDTRTITGPTAPLSTPSPNAPPPAASPSLLSQLLNLPGGVPKQNPIVISSSGVTQPASAATVSGFSFSSLPWWAWAIGAGALYFAFGRDK